MLNPYDVATEQQMQFMYQQLSEKDRCWYAVIEARKFPRGDQQYIAQ